MPGPARSRDAAAGPRAAPTRRGRGRAPRTRPPTGRGDGDPESVSVPPRRMVMKRGSRSFGRITPAAAGGGGDHPVLVPALAPSPHPAQGAEHPGGAEGVHDVRGVGRAQARPELAPRLEPLRQLEVQLVCRLVAVGDGAGQAGVGAREGVGHQDQVAGAVHQVGRALEVGGQRLPRVVQLASGDRLRPIGGAHPGLVAHRQHGHRVPEQTELVAEAVVEGPLADAGPVGHVLERRALEATRDEELECGLTDAGPRLLGGRRSSGRAIMPLDTFLHEGHSIGN